MRFLAVDPGQKRIGLAISDESGAVARPLQVLRHVSRVLDAAQVASVAHAHSVALILVGQSFQEDGRPNLAGRQSARFAEALRSQTEIRVEMWDEAFTTQDAQDLRTALGASRKKRGSDVDDLAAAALLQSYLDSHKESPA